MNPQGRQTITLREVTAQFAATTGYSVFEIVVWKPADDVVKRIPDANPTPAKTVWRAKVVVHEGRLTTEGELPQGFFTASTVTKDNPEVVYSLDSKDIVITLPAGANTDDLELFVRGDAGDESVVSAPKPATFVVVPKLNMQSGEKVACPPLNVPLGRSDAGRVPYVRAMLPSFEQRCAMTGPGLTFESATFVSCRTDPTGAGGPLATADILCRK